MSLSDSVNNFEELLEKDAERAVLIANETVTKISKTGDVHLVWSSMKPILTLRLSKNLELEFEDFDHCSQEYQDLYQLIVQRINSFQNPPFTIQRLCELLAYPKMHYNRADKYLRALEKVLMVVTVLEPETKPPTSKYFEGNAELKDTVENSSEEDEGISERKRPLPLTVELQEADSTIEDSMDISEQEEGPAKKMKWEQESDLKVVGQDNNHGSSEGATDNFDEKDVSVTGHTDPELTSQPPPMSTLSSGNEHHADLDTPQDQCLDTPQDQCLDTPQDQCLDTPQDQCLDTLQDQSLDTPQDQSLDTPQDKSLDTPQDSRVNTQGSDLNIQLDTGHSSHVDTPLDHCIDTPPNPVPAGELMDTNTSIDTN